jgi:hypothetical protein
MFPSLFTSVFDDFTSLNNQKATKADIPKAERVVQIHSTGADQPSAPFSPQHVGKIGSKARRLIVPVNAQSKKEATMLVAETSNVVRAIFVHSSEISRQVDYISTTHDFTNRRNLELEYPRCDRLAEHLPTFLGAICEEKSHHALITLNESLKLTIEGLSKHLSQAKQRSRYRHAATTDTEKALALMRRQIAEELVDKQNTLRQIHDQSMTDLVRKYQLINQTLDVSEDKVQMTAEQLYQSADDMEKRSALGDVQDATFSDELVPDYSSGSTSVNASPSVNSSHTGDLSVRS